MRLEFMFGMAKAENLAREFLDDVGGTIGLSPIVLGRPLTVQLRHGYTGDRGRAFWGDKDVLVVSAMKSTATYDDSPKAVNFVVCRSPNNKNFRTVAAVDKGTPVNDLRQSRRLDGGRAAQNRMALRAMVVRPIRVRRQRFGSIPCPARSYKTSARQTLIGRHGSNFAPHLCDRPSHSLVAGFPSQQKPKSILPGLLPRLSNSGSLPGKARGFPIHLICYFPSLTQSSSTLTVDVVFDCFPKEALDGVTQPFRAATNIPVFAPAGAYLVGVGIVIKLLGAIGNSLVNSTPALRRTEEITLVTTGSQAAVARFILLISESVPDSVLRDYTVISKGMLVKVSDAAESYEEFEPYAILSLDDRANDDLTVFTPTAACSAVVDRFYSIHESGSQPLRQLLDGLRLYNDLKFREKALAVVSKTGGLTHDRKKYHDLLNLYNAMVRNIGNDAFRPPGQG